MNIITFSYNSYPGNKYFLKIRRAAVLCVRPLAANFEVAGIKTWVKKHFPNYKKLK